MKIKKLLVMTLLATTLTTQTVSTYAKPTANYTYRSKSLIDRVKELRAQPTIKANPKEFACRIFDKDGNEVKLTAPAVIYNNTTYLPLADVGKILGISVKYSQMTNSTKVGPVWNDYYNKGNSIYYELVSNKNKVIRHHQTYESSSISYLNPNDKKAMVLTYKGRMYLPIRVFSDVTATSIKYFGTNTAQVSEVHIGNPWIKVPKYPKAVQSAIITDDTIVIGTTTYKKRPGLIITEGGSGCKEVSYKTSNMNKDIQYTGSNEKDSDVLKYKGVTFVNTNIDLTVTDEVGILDLGLLTMGYKIGDYFKKGSVMHYIFDSSPAEPNRPNGNFREDYLQGQIYSRIDKDNDYTDELTQYGWRVYAGTKSPTTNYIIYRQVGYGYVSDISPIIKNQFDVSGKALTDTWNINGKVFVCEDTDPSTSLADPSLYNYENWRSDLEEIIEINKNTKSDYHRQDIDRYIEDYEFILSLQK